jgi:hypothetical protein
MRDAPFGLPLISVLAVAGCSEIPVDPEVDQRRAADSALSAPYQCIATGDVGTVTNAIATNCGGVAGCTNTTDTHNDLRLSNSNYCACYEWLWSQRNAAPFNSVQIFYHNAAANQCGSNYHIHVQKKTGDPGCGATSCNGGMQGLWHYDLDTSPADVFDADGNPISCTNNDDPQIDRAYDCACNATENKQSGACVDPVPPEVPGTFSGLSATLGCTATFNFSYSGSTSTFHVDLGLASDLITGTYLSFGSGSGSPITVANANTKWSSYTYGTPMWFRVTNTDGTIKGPITYAGTVGCGAPTYGAFSGLSASLGCNPTFNFSYSGTSSSYIVDLGLASDLVVGTYLNFGSGSGSPITVLNAPAKWSSYTYGTPMWFRVTAKDGGIKSPITYAGTVTCGTPTGFTSASASLGCTAYFNFAYSGSSPSYSVDLSLTSNFSSGVYTPFGSGSSSPIVVGSPGTKWWNSYTQGRTLYYRIYNSDKSKSISGSAVVNCATETLGTFTSMSATLGCTPSFSFTYTGYSPGYSADLSLTADFSSGVYNAFGIGSSSPITVANPKTRWSSYTNGRPLFYRVWNAAKSRVSSYGGAYVNCPGL